MSDDVLVKRWLRRRRPRRFERGATTSPDQLRPWLRDRGWELKFQGWQGGGSGTLQRIEGKGRPRRVSMRQLLAFVDELRVAEGLQPILTPADKGVKADA